MFQALPQDLPVPLTLPFRSPPLPSIPGEFTKMLQAPPRDLRPPLPVAFPSAPLPGSPSEFTRMFLAPPRDLLLPGESFSSRFLDRMYIRDSQKEQQEPNVAAGEFTQSFPEAGRSDPHVPGANLVGSTFLGQATKQERRLVAGGATKNDLIYEAWALVAPILGRVEGGHPFP